MEIFESVVCPASDESPRNSEGSIVKLAGGRLLLAWADYYSGADDLSAARISAKISSDGGRTWGEKFTLRENVGNVNVVSPSFVRLLSGEIGLSYGFKDSATSWKADFVKSADEGATWSDPVGIVQGPGCFEFDDDRLIQTRGGRLIAPISWSLVAWAEGVNYKAFCCFSDDNGVTWRRGKGQMEVPGYGADEPAAIELGDGRLLMLARTDQGCVYQSHSADGGDTWTESEPTSLDMAKAHPVNLKRIPATGDILVVWSRGEKRNPITAAISRDEADSWVSFKDLDREEGADYGYPSIAFDGDQVLITYYVRYGDCLCFPHADNFVNRLSVKLKIIPVTWFYQ